MVSQYVDYWKSPPRRRADQVAPPGSARKPTAASRRQSRQQLAQAQRPQSPIWVSPGPDCLIFLRIFLEIRKRNASDGAYRTAAARVRRFICKRPSRSAAPDGQLRKCSLRPAGPCSGQGESLPIQVVLPQVTPHRAKPSVIWLPTDRAWRLSGAQAARHDCSPPGLRASRQFRHS